ncbi:phosphoadenosine phosphosulfate reductase family protein [Paenibacillus oleatilyticus]|uniref:phosphoadenosine phosphosulfate reductase family protein n=1 Tax=Paenibacillus oleatilyticus TaxID=2594886 RepID=UPI0020A77F16|nr:phosphoadenosine phosphosulfate reductase family protein [Paenibacillus oleatilyticus]
MEEKLNDKGKKITRWNGTRADKETRYAHFNIHKYTILKDKERWSIDLIKMSLQRSVKPVISCSFGIDSIIDVYLTRKALIELGRDPSDIDIVWNDTANEFKEVRQYQKYITELWKLRLYVTKPKKTLKHIIDDNGGITSDYFFTRKGDRRGGRPLSEKCCGTLKHDPMKRITKDMQWDLLVVGLRADESSQRLKAGLRDGEYFYSSAEWKAFVVRPILWWTEKDVWEYVEQEGIPYNELYLKNMIQEYPMNTEEIVFANKELIESVGLDYYDLGDRETQIVNRKQAIILEKLGFKLFTPRTGCMMCPIPVKYGYMQWIRLNYDKVYNAMVYNLGYGEALVSMIPKEVREEIEYIMGIELTPENIHIHLREILEVKPCTFDKF